jgi:hypothetical protein
MTAGGSSTSTIELATKPIEIDSCTPNPADRKVGGVIYFADSKWLLPDELGRFFRRTGNIRKFVPD